MPHDELTAFLPEITPTWASLNSGAKLAICCFKLGSGSSVQ